MSYETPTSGVGLSFKIYFSEYVKDQINTFFKPLNHNWYQVTIHTHILGEWFLKYSVFRIRPSVLARPILTFSFH